MSYLKRSVRKSLRENVFPETWYIVDHWLGTQKGRKVAVIGTGEGLYCRALVQRGYEVWGTDHSSKNLQKTQSLLEKSQLETELEESQSHQIPKQSDEFDSVVIAHYLEHTQDMTATVLELARILKPGGRAVIAFWRPYQPWGWSFVAKMLRAQSETFRPVTTQEFRRAVQKAGLKVDSAKARVRYLPFQFGSRKIPWPWAGSWVAMLEKPLPNEGKRQAS